MADIDIQCPECKTLMSISEFGEFSTVACRHCRHQIEVPRRHQSPATGNRLRVKKKEEPTSKHEEGEKTFLSQIQPPKRRKPKSEWHISQHIIAWALFLVLGTAMYFLRYRGILDKGQLDLLTRFAPLVIVAFHILIVLKAFQDAVMHGILCLLIPFYSFVYLIFISDDFYARAVAAGLLVGMAEDSYFFFQTYAVNVYNAINAWLATGG